MYFVAIDDYVNVTLPGNLPCMVGTVISVAGERSAAGYKIMMQFPNEGGTTLIGRLVVDDAEVKNIQDDRIERLALALAIVHIGDSDCLGRMGRELEKLLLAKYPRLLPWEDDNDND